MDLYYIKSTLNNLANLKRVKDIKNYLLKDEIDYIIEHANNLLNQTFIFDKPWDMERCITPYTLKNIDWNTVCNNDEEWCFMLNRMEYLSDLVLAYLITNDIKYSNKAKFYILDWIEKHPIIKWDLSSRTLDTAMRILNWTWACIILENENLFEDKELLIICESMLKQIQYLKNEYFNQYKLSNWGSIQTTSIYCILPILLENYKNDELYKWVYNEMNSQFSIQLYPDGTFWEQSMLYHAEVLNYGMSAIYFHKVFNKTDSEPLWIKQINALAEALLYQVTPNIQIENFGDSDRISARDIFNRASVIFNNSKYKYASSLKYDIESLYMFGCNYADKHKKIVSEKPTKNIYDGKYSGIYTIKSGWEENDSFTMFTNGSLGGGHGHCDNLHISISYKGENMLIDSGRYTYVEENQLRLQLKSSYAHNVLILNDKPYCKPSSSWGYDKFGMVLKNYVNHINNYHYLEGGIVGDNPLQIWIRKVIVINPNIWLIVDDIRADGENKATLNYHIDPYKEVIQKDNIIYIKGNNGNLKVVQNCKPVLKTEKCSLHYNELLEHKVVCYNKQFKDKLQLITCICDENIQIEDSIIYQGSKEASNELAQAKKFKISNNESYTIVVFHKEICNGQQISFCEDIAFYGKCVIIHEKNGEKNIELMKA